MSNKFVREEINFLKGARGRWNELKYAIGVVFQFMKGFRTLHFVGPCVTVFGSARFGEDHPYYVQARELSAKLADQGFTIMTGGGPGIWKRPIGVQRTWMEIQWAAILYCPMNRSTILTWISL